VSNGEKKRHGSILAAGLSMIVALLIVAPFFRLGNASGHDFEFHAASWLEVARQWHQGILYPRWHEWANHGFGEPRFIFYPPLSWMLGALLGVVLPWNAVPAAFIVLAQTLAGLSAFALTRKLADSRAALLAAALYAGNPYALLVSYVRSDFAEQLAAAIFPLVVLAVLELTGLVETDRPLTSQIVRFALLFAAVWLCNAPAGVLAGYSVAALLAIRAIQTRSRQVLLSGGAGILLGLGIAGFYLIPAAYEQKWVNIGQALAGGLTPAENFLFSRTSDAEHDLFNARASVFAVAMMAATALAFIVLLRSRKRPLSPSALWLLGLLALVASLLMWRGSWLFWLAAPKLKFVQFPWRLMVVLAVPYAVLLGSAIGKSRRVVALVLIAAVTVLSGAAARYLVKNSWWDPDDIPTLESWLNGGQGFEGTDEYDPAGDDHTDLPASATQIEILPAEGQRAPQAVVEIRSWRAEDRSLFVRSHGPARLALRLVNYPAWRVEANGRKIVPAHPEGTGQILVDVPPGDTLIRIRFERTRDRTVGNFVSWVSLVVALALVFGPGLSRGPDRD
jgi:hypothetical protein